MNDTISRQKAINMANAMYAKCDTGDTMDLRDMIVAGLDCLPSAQPEITGEDVQEWCHKRRLTIIGKELYFEMRNSWMRSSWSASAQPDRSGQERTGGRAY